VGWRLRFARNAQTSAMRMESSRSTLFVGGGESASLKRTGFFAGSEAGWVSVSFPDSDTLPAAGIVVPAPFEVDGGWSTALRVDWLDLDVMLILVTDLEVFLDFLASPLILSLCEDFTFGACSWLAFFDFSFLVSLSCQIFSM